MEAPREELTTGITFAERYQIIEELGKGGMGRVYKAVDKEIEAKAALKLIKPEIAADVKTIERFRNELKTAREISHKNVCRMYHLGKYKGSHYITMEYVSGEDLKSFIRRSRRLTAGTAISIAQQIAEGLAEAHRLGVVHRDLKPQNVMIDSEGNAKIMDFGIARSLKAKGITATGVMIGTPEYMSPEQVEGKGVDPRSDIYSLGVILYEMVTGRVPFEGETPLSVAVKQKTERARDPRELNAQIPEALSRVILKCMEKEKEERYQTAGELLADLESIESGLPTTERSTPKRKPFTSREITVKFSLRKLFIPVLVVGVLVVAAFFAIKLFHQKEVIPPSQGKPSLAVLYFKNNTGDQNLDHWRMMIADLITADLTQSKYIDALSGERLFKILSNLDQLEAKNYSSDVLSQVASQGGVNHILVGNYAKAGDAIRINITLEDAGTEKVLGSEGVEGKGEESIFAMVDELTRKIKADFRLTSDKIAGDIDRDVGIIITSSPQAFQYYIEGRKSHIEFKDRQSIAFMEKAAAVDPGFAMAYRSMAMSYNNLGFMSERNKYMQKALALSDRLSDREHFQIQGDFYLGSEKTYNKAIETYNKLLELYPEDTTANHNLGIIYQNIEDWDKAIKYYEVCRRVQSRFTASYNQLAEVYRAKGLYEKAAEVLKFYLDNIADDVYIHQGLAENYLCQGKYGPASIELDKAASVDPTNFLNYYIRGILFQYEEKFSRAEQEYRKLLAEKEPRSGYSGMKGLVSLYLLRGMFEKAKALVRQGIALVHSLGIKWVEAEFRLLLCDIELKSGNPEEALGESQTAWDYALEADSFELYIQGMVLFIKGESYLELGEIEKAHLTADQLLELINKSMNKKAVRYHSCFMGLIALRKENASQSIPYLKEGLSLLPAQWSFSPISFNRHALIMEPLALAYFKSGDLKAAQEEYGKIISLTSGRLLCGDIYARAFYMLGRIHEQLGDKEKAIKNYEKFLFLWKEADPGLPELTDARKRLALQK